VAKKKRGLGRGLDALMGGATATSPEPVTREAPVMDEEVRDGEVVIYLDPRNVQPNPKQPRKTFDDESLEELAESIRKDGIQSPVVVRQRAGTYELVSGERRTRAALMAGLDRIPAICREVSDRDMLRLGLIENIQREDLNYIELARAYKKLIDELGWTQEQLADEVGKKRTTVTNTLRLLNLPDDVQDRVADGSIQMGHARALLAFASRKGQSDACKRIIEDGLSVREVERLAAAPKAKPKPKPAPPKDPNITTIEDELKRKLGTRVSLHTRSGGKGALEIEYTSLDELDRLLTLLRSLR
jgi:ParB family transcriptional regulator, chromosome partitioning protein